MNSTQTYTQNYVQDVEGIQMEYLPRFVPSIYAPSKHESRSERYTYIPTSHVLEGLIEAGFYPTMAQQSRSRIEGKEAYTKHLLRLRKREHLGLRDPEVVEYVIKNSHDGTSAYEIMIGVFRLVCTNGMVRWSEDEMLKVYHKGNVVDNVVESTLTMAREHEEVMDQVAQFKSIQLDLREQLLLAEHVHKARFEDSPNTVFTPGDLLRTHRSEDKGDASIWTTMNVVQENAIQGGITRYDNKLNKHKMRKVQGIDQSTKLNQLVWAFGEELRKIHQGN